MFKLNLGIVYKEGVLVNHRSLLKIIINPFIGMFGWVLVSEISNHNIDRIHFMKCIVPSSGLWGAIHNAWVFNMQDKYLVRKRILF